jgi:hypothetical protein
MKTKVSLSLDCNNYVYLKRLEKKTGQNISKIVNDAIDSYKKTIKDQITLKIKMKIVEVTALQELKKNI